MRAPRQERKELAAAYTVRQPLKVTGILMPGAVVLGNEARSWPTFRTLLNIGWITPRGALALPAPVVDDQVAVVSGSAPPASPRRKGVRR